MFYGIDIYKKEKEIVIKCESEELNNLVYLAIKNILIRAIEEKQKEEELTK